MQLNDLVFGNPSRQHLIYLETENFLDSLLKELASNPAPTNQSEDSSQELIELMKYTNHLKEDEGLLRRFVLYDADLEAYILKRLSDYGIPEEDIRNLIIEVHKDVAPLLFKLKYHYNRIRPFQLASYKKMQFHHWRTRSSDSPSYPCGHTFQAKIYAEVLGGRYPKYYKPLHELADDVSWSRQYLGSNYPTDKEFALYAADVVLKHPEFMRKYKL